jgi:hypothetical protein
LEEVIDLRRRAYELYPVGALTKLLAVDYENLGLYCIAAGRPASDSFDAFINAIRYSVDDLRALQPESSDWRAALRRVSDIYAEISEIGDLDADRKRHAAFIEDCLHTLATR